MVLAKFTQDSPNTGYFFVMINYKHRGMKEHRVRAAKTTKGQWISVSPCPSRALLVLADDGLPVSNYINKLTKQRTIEQLNKRH